MYKNLIAELNFNKITQNQISCLLNVRPATVSDKLRGVSKFYFDEALKIKKTYFPHTEIEYLFQFDEQN